MRLGQLITVLLCLPNLLFAQTFTTSPGVTIPNNSTITSNISVTGVGTIDCSYGLTEVCIDLSHTRDADMDIFLIDPAGDSYELTTDNGGTGNNYIVTCFDMTALTNVTAGSAPFNGSYVPEGDIGLANNGQDADGTWTLEVTDDRSGQTGTLNEWSLTFGSSPECGPTPTSEDCAGGTTVCSDATFTGNSSGSGNISDLDASNDGCLSGENESSWFYFSAATDGTYAFMIETAVDYDFAVWGPDPDVVCPPVGAPIRCSYSGTAGDTGLESGAGDETEGAGGDAIVDPIVATAGDVYVIIIDNYTADGSDFDLVWTLSGGATLDCTPLPIELVYFTGYRDEGVNRLNWKSLTEKNNDYYFIERSTDGNVWITLDHIDGTGNSSTTQVYEFEDRFFDQAVNYYRLTQVDFDGKQTRLKTISIDNRNTPARKLVQIVNLMGMKVDENYDGVKVYVYDDGSYEKIVGNK